ncbi:hypothetical protein EON65_46540 [archaeon]|nr:MAG: hypothetical protein EON65_46540 [archaeon]
MKSKSNRYVHVPNYFTVDECEQSKTYGHHPHTQPYGVITFANQRPTRFQKTIYRCLKSKGSTSLQGPANYLPPPCILSFIALFNEIHSKTKQMTWKLLKSTPTCDVQPLHTDDNEMSENNTNKKFNDSSFSIVISLEITANKAQLVLACGVQKPHTIRTINLSQGSFVIFRGDMPHAGGSYDIENIRCFVAIGTNMYGHKGLDVGLLNKM